MREVIPGDLIFSFVDTSILGLLRLVRLRRIATKALSPSNSAKSA